MKIFKEWLDTYPYPSNWFIGAALVLSASNMLGPVAKEDMVTDILGFVVMFTFFAILSILFTSWHWFIFGSLSRRYPSQRLMTAFGSILFCTDAYVRIGATYFSGSPRGPVFSLLLYFIPFLGLGILLFHLLGGWLWSRQRTT